VLRGTVITKLKLPDGKTKTTRSTLTVKLKKKR